MVVELSESKMQELKDLIRKRGEETETYIIHKNYAWRLNSNKVLDITLHDNAMYLLKQVKKDNIYFLED